MGQGVAGEHDASAVGREVADVLRLHSFEECEQGFLCRRFAERLVEGGGGFPGASGAEVAEVAS